MFEILNPATQGVAIERADVETYKTADYMLSSAQRHRPGKFGDQQHMLASDAAQPRQCLFDPSAAVRCSTIPRATSRPSYWVGNGIHPDVAQDQNRLFMIYDTTPRKGFLERGRQHFVHYFVPVDRFSETPRQYRTRGTVGRRHVHRHSLFASD
ncbi:MAG: hypothetical protein MZU97_05875 [Bacillus subtilis]|nr:hypothetical protein [Bacillus subtilis]